MTLSRKDFNSLSDEDKYNELIKLTQKNKFDDILYYIPTEIKNYDPTISGYFERLIYLHYTNVLGGSGQYDLCLMLLTKFLKALKKEEVNNPDEYAHVALVVCGCMERYGFFEIVLENLNFFLDVLLQFPLTFENFSPRFLVVKIRVNAHLEHYNENELNDLIEFIKTNRNSDNVEYLECLKTYMQIEYKTYRAESIIVDIESKINDKNNPYIKYYNYYLAVIHHESFALKKSYDLFNEILEKPLVSNFSLLLESLYRINEICYDSITFEQKIFIRAYPNLKNIIRTTNKFSRNIYKQITDSKTGKDVWKISNNELKDLDYKEIDDPNVLDLTVGLLIKNYNVEMILSKLRTVALVYIIGSSYLGITTLELARLLFWEEKVTLDTMHLRVQDLITQLKKIGFPVNRNKGRIYFVFDKFSYEIVFPKDFKFKELVYFLAKKSFYLETKMTCEILNIGRSQYWNLVKKWKTQNLIQKDDQGDRYKIVLK